MISPFIRGSQLNPDSPRTVLIHSGKPLGILHDIAQTTLYTCFADAIQGSWTMSPVQYLNSIAENFGEQIALDDSEIAVSYEELAVAVQAMSVALANLDPNPGSTVAICADYCHEYLVTVLAVQAAGKKLLPLSTHATTEQLADIVNAALPSAIVVDARGDALIPCDEDFKIHFSQFPGLVFTYRGETLPGPDSFESFFPSPKTPENADQA